MRAIVLLLAAGLAFAQDPVRFRADVNLVNVGFTVRDARGALVAGLGRDDFEVFEDGTPQTIAAFTRSADSPLALGLVVDASGSQARFVNRHWQDVRRFLDDVLTARDMAFLVAFANRIRLLSDFSSRPTVLLDMLATFDGGERRFPDLGPKDTRLLGTAFYDAIYYSIREKLAHAGPGRRALVVFSDGEDNSSAYHMLDAIEAAQTEDTRLFMVRYTEQSKQGLNARNKYGIRVMERLAKETGGLDYDGQKTDLKTAFRHIGEELRATYELAYRTPNPARDGEFRKIRIVAKQPGLAVRAKTGYFAR
jgi:Ca-activated chloride channel homolog